MAELAEGGHSVERQMTQRMTDEALMTSYQAMLLDGPCVAAERLECAEAVRKIFAGFPMRVRRVLAWRYGLDDGIERSLREIGDRIGRSAERARQIEAKALMKLRHPSRAIILMEHL